MKFVKLKSFIPFIYTYEDSSDAFFEVLGMFLSTEIRSQRSYDHFMNWLQKPLQGLCGNVYCLIKRDDKIYIYSQFVEDEEVFNFFYCSNKEMFDIINQWVTVVDSNPDEILITQEGNEVKISRTDGIECGNKHTLINQDEIKK